MISRENLEAIRKKYRKLKTEFDERSRRMCAGTEAKALGRGGVRAVAKATGIAESAIRIGCHEIEASSY